jgi:hypothetical protein
VSNELATGGLKIIKTSSFINSANVENILEVTVEKHAFLIVTDYRGNC